MRILRDGISLTCEFTNRQLEQEYLENRFSAIRKNSRPMMILLFILFFLFSIPDYCITRGGPTFLMLLAVRLLAVGTFLALYFALGRMSTVRSYSRTLWIYSLIFPVFFLALVSLYPNFNFYVRCLDAIVVMLIIFILPNRWLFTSLSALFNCLLLILYTLIVHKELNRGDWFSGTAYLLLFYLINCFIHYFTGYRRRVHFHNNLVLTRLLNTDTLTGTVSRVKFDEEFRLLFQKAREQRSSLCLSIFDVDDFKAVNDTFGHLEGDSVLKAIARIIFENKREEDVFARWGGEEFVILYPQTDINQAYALTEKFRARIASHTFELGFRVTCSFGVTEMTLLDTPMSLLRRADELMYLAKARDKNIVVCE